ncbi:YihY/virulence factor BrkB family protein [Streptomyces sp. ISL-96]|uniref:YihY/virulence factor BrkB family protein n=1 Tax=Streptomyces sp. ISL-96 TaxID=2819191 RepID=UPI001BE8F2EA|nr:YihY/virulence factor BrkB family protein [Streptomyces sp. ISL-96]MBT2490003.1 YihY/virulence factor BrkB family protein [Streptomyces sp. ISL-96]
MDWLKRLPVVGPFVTRLTITHAWRTYETLDRVHWTRLAAAITFISFLSLFPLITVSAAIGAALLSDDQLHRMENKIAEQVPGISGQLDLASLVENAGTVGLVAGALLLFTGIGWVGSMRECLRAVWELDDVDEGNPILRKLKDGVVLGGLGVIGLSSWAASSIGSTAVDWTAEQIGIPESGAGGVMLRIAALVLAVGADFLILLYVLTLLPGVQPARHRLITASLIGAVGFELLKVLLGSYMKGVAAKSMYGAFGVPVALLLWINLTAKLLLCCAAWTATRHADERAADEDDGSNGSDGSDAEKAEDAEDAAPAAAPPAAAPPAGGPRPGSPPPGGAPPISGEGGGAPGRAAASAG